MPRSTIYLLAILLLISMGGAFHSHEAHYNASDNDQIVYITAHHCNDHTNHPDIEHHNYCQQCSRVVTSSISECTISKIGDIVVVNELPAYTHIDTFDQEYLLLSEPRSPPHLS